jgi:hypothetical protein
MNEDKKLVERFQLNRREFIHVASAVWWEDGLLPVPSGERLGLLHDQAISERLE